MSGSVEDAIVAALAEAGEGRSVTPEQVARALDLEGWRRRLPQVRACAVGMARRGALVITRHGKPADPETFKGVYRLKRPIAEAIDDQPSGCDQSVPSARDE